MSILNSPKIFISYSWDNKIFVERLETELKSAGADVWVDHSEIRGGDNLPERISQALGWCDTLLLIWSETAERSKWVTLEWTNAISLDKVIIPCLLDNNKLPPILANKIFIDFQNYGLGKTKLFRSLKLVDPQLERQEEGKDKLSLAQKSGQLSYQGEKSLSLTSELSPEGRKKPPIEGIRDSRVLQKIGKCSKVFALCFRP